MNKVLATILCLTTFAYVVDEYKGDTLAPVIIAGSIVKHQGTEIAKKYPRKSCPVCKGTGKYRSGDDISLVDCGYCEPEKGAAPLSTQTPKQKGCIQSVR